MQEKAHSSGAFVLLEVVLAYQGNVALSTFLCFCRAYFFLLACSKGNWAGRIQL